MQTQESRRRAQQAMARKDNKTWQFSPDAPTIDALLSKLTPEQVCCYQSMMAGQLRLTRAGLPPDGGLTGKCVHAAVWLCCCGCDCVVVAVWLCCCGCGCGCGWVCLRIACVAVLLWLWLCDCESHRLTWCVFWLVAVVDRCRGHSSPPESIVAAIEEFTRRRKLVRAKALAPSAHAAVYSRWGECV